MKNCSTYMVGPLVRLGPDTVILNDVAHFAEYFTYSKSPWAEVFRARLDVFDHGTVADIEEHAKYKKQVMGAYSMSHVLKSECVVDFHVTKLMGSLENRAEDEVFDLIPWLHFFAFDAVLDVAFSNTPGLGFLETGSDVQGIIATLHKIMPVGGVLTMYPAVVAFFQKRQWLFSMIAPNTKDITSEKVGLAALYHLGWSQVEQRMSLEGQGEENKNDILQWLIERENKDGERLSKARLEQECVAPVLAGSDTVATVLRAVIFFVSTNPRILKQLRAEIDAADFSGLLSTPPRFQEIKEHIPYMSAIMKEALRLYPVIALPLFRATPKYKAVTLCGFNLPPETEIGICHHAVGRNQAIFGTDTDLFRPERWTEEVDPAMRKLRTEGDVFFGTGVMMCTGRNLATMEVWKVAIQLFREFDVEIVNPLEPWKWYATIALIAWDFDVKLKRREATFEGRFDD
ncbi:hypothetical protein EG328_003077 [Venturia inaequalis]|uniref:Cytochrome P450 n=1 Tax=Venturia inaequalis TaxID=5025 RepID=A0A8H3Z8S0_VENIN|nr:hypothetical protein EG328_003077 [Venturia inaequalis]KAE9993858.1 hypothetical protein EG327_002765 [Venturia inaequalis]